MKEYLKIIDKKKMILVLFFSIIYNLSIYAISFCVSSLLVSPVTSNKLYILLISLIMLYMISLIPLPARYSIICINPRRC